MKAQPAIIAHLPPEEFSPPPVFTVTVPKPPVDRTDKPAKDSRTIIENKNEKRCSSRRSSSRQRKARHFKRGRRNSGQSSRSSSDSTVREKAILSKLSKQARNLPRPPTFMVSRQLQKN